MSEVASMSICTSSFVQALCADGPSADRAGKMDLYGWLVGAWALDVIEFLDDGTQRRRPGEWHFGWVLEGRAIQDVWIVPPRGARGHADAVAQQEYCGTTLRVYDPSSDDWHVQYTDPVIQARRTMTARRQGDAIVQLGSTDTGQPVRWSFDRITRDAFRWRGEWSADGGETWHLRIEFLARRTDSG
jgi:hypothetical protein